MKCNYSVDSIYLFSKSNINILSEMSSISSICIPFVEKGISAKYIVDVFRENSLAKVSKITMFPYKTKKLNKYQYIYVDILEWRDTESAHSFILSLKNQNKETRIMHSEPLWWSVHVNNALFITNFSQFEIYSTDFTKYHADLEAIEELQMDCSSNSDTDYSSSRSRTVSEVSSITRSTFDDYIDMFVFEEDYEAENIIAGTFESVRDQATEELVQRIVELANADEEMESISDSSTVHFIEKIKLLQ